MSHDAYKANLLRMKVTNLGDANQLPQALAAAEQAIAYPAASLPSDPMADDSAVDAQALFDWAVGLEIRGIVFRRMGDFAKSIFDFDRAELTLRRILLQFPMQENYAALARILHNRANTYLAIPEALAGGKDLTNAIIIRRKLATGDAEELDLLAGSLAARSSAFLLIGELDYALTDALEAVKIRRAEMPQVPDVHQRRTFAKTLRTLAIAQQASRKSGDACQSIKEALGLLSELPAHVKAIAAADLAEYQAIETQVCRGYSRDTC
ncbi:MAG TPA: hypothetical protein VMZ30_09985 [Pyrinomonadaceae bacterium]|nr:hypothetical protein [Pyrinomonadaceae bacterium]